MTAYAAASLDPCCSSFCAPGERCSVTHSGICEVKESALLRQAVTEWAQTVGAVHVGSAAQRLLHLAREMGLGEGGQP